MANNELSGPIVSMQLINDYITKPKKTLRFVFIPETIGSLTYLSEKLTHLKNIIGGYNLSYRDDRNIHVYYLNTRIHNQIKSFRSL